jgi:hypothetical protein
VYSVQCTVPLAQPTPYSHAPVIWFLKTCVWVAVDMILNVVHKHVTRFVA